MGQPIKIYVGNIPQSARNSELKELFEKFGKVVECDILKEFAFVHMEDTNDAKAAIAGLNDSLWKGARIRVELSTTKTSKGEPSMRHRMANDDMRRRRNSRDRDHRGRSPPYMRDSRGYDRFGGGGGYGGGVRSGDMRGPMRDSRYGGPPPRSRPYPDGYDRRAYPEPRGGPMPPRGGYPPEYPFHPSSYREPMRDHRGGPYPDPYARGPPMGYGQPMPPYYRGPPHMGGPGRFDYPPQGYPSRPSRYSPPMPGRDVYREKDYRGISPRGNSREQPTFNGHRHGSPTMNKGGKRHHSSDSRSVSPARRNGNYRQRDQASYSRSPSPNAAASRSRNGSHKKSNTNASNDNNGDRSSSRSQSPKQANNSNGRHHEPDNSSRSRSTSPASKPHRHRKSKNKKHASSGSSSNNSSMNEPRRHNHSKSNGHNNNKSVSPVGRKKAKTKRAASSSPSRSRSRSPNHSPLKA